MLLSSVSASVAQSIRLQGPRPSGAFIRCSLSLSLSLSLLCSFPLSLLALLPIKIQSSVVRLHYITAFSPLFAAQRRMLSRAPFTATILHILKLLQNTVNMKILADENIPTADNGHVRLPPDR